MVNKTPMHLHEVECANCKRKHIRKDGYPAISHDGTQMVSLCCPGCRDKHKRR